MKKVRKRSITILLIALILPVILFWPGLPWSARCRHALKRWATKAEMKVAAWQGQSPRRISLSGRVTTASSGPLAGGQIEALDSVSGWAALTDRTGRFVLRDVIWYPKADYTLIVEANAYQTRQIKLSAPEIYPVEGVLDLGELSFEGGCLIDTSDLSGRNSISYVAYDERNIEHYKKLFDGLTEGRETDEEKLEAINRYVASKFVATDSSKRYRAPREVLDKGSHSGWGLVLTMATIAEAGNYKTRMIDLIDGASPLIAHMVIEVYYGNGWHLYDPVIGTAFRNKSGKVASYKEIRMDASLISLEHVPKELFKIFDYTDDKMAAVYNSGFHHYYHFSKEE
ncbi:MAG: carboxypeptidase-like regulatory domain-containing protein [Blastocatellia bacterium]|nr:carboxypeptidase-like regulatory domain-containing protein [Blastocatellia bacterium]